MLFITGVTGLTGRFLIDCLREAGYRGPIRCLVREHSDVSWIRDKDNTELYLGDVSNVKSLKVGLKGIEGVIHLVNIRFSPQIIEACHSANVKRVIIVSTTGIYSKYRECSEEYKSLEKIIIESGLDYTIIRPTMIYGNQRDKNIHRLIMIIDKFPVIPVVGDGTGLMQPIYARDLARAIAEAYVRPVSIGKAYNVAGKNPIKYIEILKLIADKLRKRRLFVKIPYSISLLAGYIGSLLNSKLIDVEKVKRVREDKVFDYSDAVRDLDFSPISFEEGIQLEINALREVGLIRA
ncbi:NAD-dependent epimerase [Thermacetogenium phaeum DSM 12270]|uniref:NAD-dependent epimerase n=1 Tax=Thermacetogenium phaeum (strain ATCC BAA-254 / DSM 26808 / PB) TaxID=1089553 RepID=K4LCN0_THEPS|nr:NAD-dependent epimerase/dehydratase family protein [Thermacetogenium phaeum]AFV10513.1 NAD-dependent epimerase [Thermacetogenium phaeum DSM 12270]